MKPRRSCRPSGQKVTAIKGQTIFDAATAADVSIPDLCSDPRINPSVNPGARMDHAKQFDVIMHTVSDAEGRIFAGH
jgi:hypothetical protein